MYLSKTESGYCFDLPADDLEERSGVRVGEVTNMEGMGLLLDRSVTAFEVIGGQSRVAELASSFLLAAGLSLAGFCTWDLFQIDAGACPATLATDLGLELPAQAAPQQPARHI